MTTSGTNLAGAFPGLRALDVRVPERPGPTLSRSRFVSSAFPRGGIKQNAIIVGPFPQTATNANLAHALLLEFRHIRVPHGGCQSFNFQLVHPDVARRTGAAITASGALKGESVSIPRSVGHVAFFRRSR